MAAMIVTENVFYMYYSFWTEKPEAGIIDML
jgi:hypothetical protein